MESGWNHRGLALLPAMLLAVVLVFAAGGADTARAEPAPAAVVQAGHDLLETDSGVTYIDLSGDPIPADFFGPGSDPFDGTVQLEGVPFDSFGTSSGLLPTDTIVERLQDAGTAGFPDTIDIEIVRLELKSVAPITVTWNGGQDPNLYDVTVQVLDGPVPAQSMGSMTIRHEFADGGTFDAQLPVTPRFTFTNVDPEAPPPHQGPFELDGPQIDFSASGPWCHTANPLDDPPGHVVVEVAGLTTNFFPGITCGLPRTKATVVMTAPSPSATAHGVRSAEVVTANTAQAGHDLLETDSSETRVDFSGDPIPADFFGPGSDPFDGTVALEGVPFDSFGAYSELLPTDTIVERLENAGPGFPATIDIEIVRLELKSVEPITVTYNGGQDPEEWDLTVQVLEGPDPVQQTGSMTINHEYADGGTFDVLLPVEPILTFRQANPPNMVMVLDWHAEGRDPFLFQATGENWCHTANPLDDPPDHVVVEVPGLTSNFFPGITCQSPRTKGTVVMTAAGATAHGVRPAENAAAVGGVAELPPLAETSADEAGAPTDGSGWSAGAYAALAGGLAAAALALGGGAWYARRRWLH